MARDMAEAEEIVAVMKRTGRKLMMYQPRRADASTQAIKRIIGLGFIGEVYMIKYDWPAYLPRNDWQAFKKYGGGMLNNYGAHAIDAALYTAGSAASKISASMFSVATAGDADDVVKALIETKNGVAVDIDINMAAAVTMPQNVVYGRLGTAILVWDDNGRHYHIRYYDPAKQEQKFAASELTAAEGRRYITAQPALWEEKDIPVSERDELDYYEECYKYFALVKSRLSPSPTQWKSCA
jgi:predicted dehydrogenase